MDIKSDPSSSQDSLKKPQVDWEDFNYPPCLNLFHYNLNEVEDVQEKQAIKYVKGSFLISLFSLAINFTNAIALTIAGDDSGRIIFYSVLHFLIFSPISLYVFYHGYKSILSEKSQIQNYLWQQLFCAICYFIFSIVKGGAFNGFLKTNSLFHTNLKLQASLSLIESISYLSNSIYCLFVIYQVKKLQKQQSNTDKNESDKEMQISTV